MSSSQIYLLASTLVNLHGMGQAPQSPIRNWSGGGFSHGAQTNLVVAVVYRKRSGQGSCIDVSSNDLLQKSR